MRPFRVLTFFICLLASFSAVADEWDALSSARRPGCDKANACRIIEPGGTFDIKIDFQVRRNKKHFAKLRIKNLETGTTQEFALEQIRPVDETEFFEIYKVHIRPGRGMDLALHALDSAREGELYYYFFYDPSVNSFVRSDDIYPKMISHPESKEFWTALQSTKYRLDKTLKFNPVGD